MLTANIRHTLSLKPYPCDGGPLEKTQCALSAILKSSHSLSLHGYFIRYHSHTADSSHMASFTGSLHQASHEVMILSNYYEKLSRISQWRLIRLFSSDASVPQAYFTCFSFHHLNLRLFSTAHHSCGITNTDGISF